MLPIDPRNQGGPELGTGQMAQRAEVYAVATLLTMVRDRVPTITNFTIVQRKLTTLLRGRAVCGKNQRDWVQAAKHTHKIEAVHSVKAHVGDGEAAKRAREGG